MTGGMGLIHNGEEYLENHYYPLLEEGLNYHGVNENGIDVDWMSTGSRYATQYCDPIAERYDSIEKCPEKYLLSFYHLPRDHELVDGTAIIQRLYDNCFADVEEVKRLQRQ